MITVELYFDDDGISLRATFSAESMADAIGCPVNHASQFAGQICLELHECVNAETGEEHSPTAYQMEWLQNAALD